MAQRCRSFLETVAVHRRQLRSGGPLGPIQCIPNPIRRISDGRNTPSNASRYEQFELERKKKRDQAKARRRVPPPFISVKDTINETTVVVPDIKVIRRFYSTCSYKIESTWKSSKNMYIKMSYLGYLVIIDYYYQNINGRGILYLMWLQ